MSTPRKQVDGRFVTTTNPGVTHDDVHGYRASDIWLNKTTREQFMCVSNGTGAAVWASLTGHRGTATLIAGEKVVSDTRITADSMIMITSQDGAGTPGYLYVSARSVGVSFTITSSEEADTSLVAYHVIEPVA